MKRSHLRRLVLLLLLFVPLVSMGQETETPQTITQTGQESAAQYRLLFHSGRVVVGEIVLRNEEVVIVKDSYGSRFQYPLSDIVEITEILEDKEQQVSGKGETNSRSVSNVKRTSLGVRVAGGLASLDGSLGGAIAADFRLGANNLGGMHIFLGGQVGYRALIVEGRTLSIIPIDVALELPVTQFQHTPMIGANIGYGIGLGGIRGGVNAGLSIGYRYQFSRTGALHVGIGAEVQQLAKATHTITVEPEQTFVSDSGRTAVMGMLTFGVLF